MSNSPSATHLLANNDQKESDIVGNNANYSATASNINYDNNSSLPNNVQNVDKGMTSTLLLAVFAAVSGTAFHFGYASGVMNSPQDFIQQFINETNHRRNNETQISDSTVTLIL
ncbi:unnamed protein product [Adineta steineri]|uniref:Uncharacterized protein n=1 Tax=Adineta steineri TaxID=433720 RepID=A0A820L5D6_9BILA|nr:unnamed protein product [Adineta steineri]